jgi:hypothetical protein
MQISMLSSPVFLRKVTTLFNPVENGHAPRHYIYLKKQLVNLHIYEACVFNFFFSPPRLKDRMVARVARSMLLMFGRSLSSQ